jgi:uncharacterized protein YkwD
MSRQPLHSPPAPRSTARALVGVSIYRSVATLVVAVGLLAGGMAPALSAPVPVAGAQPTASGCTTTPDPGSWSKIAWEIHRLINEQRTQNGVPKLAVDQGGVTNAAIKHSVNMSKTGIFSHVIDGKGPADRLRDENVSFTAWGENIYYSYCQSNGKPAYNVDGFAQQAVSGWMNSPGHRANILNPNFTHTGIGIAAVPRDGKGYIYATQVFIKP